MSLFHPTPGQIYDRISILKLKIDAYTKAKKNTETLTTELRDCEGKVHRESSAEISFLINSLHETNSELWDCEDLVRMLPAPQQYFLADLAVRIARLNDLRSNLIRQIDSVGFCANHTEEKIYS